MAPFRSNSFDAAVHTQCKSESKQQRFIIIIKSMNASRNWVYVCYLCVFCESVCMRFRPPAHKRQLRELLANRNGVSRACLKHQKHLLADGVLVSLLCNVCLCVETGCCRDRNRCCYIHSIRHHALLALHSACQECILPSNKRNKILV